MRTIIKTGLLLSALATAGIIGGDLAKHYRKYVVKKNNQDAFRVVARDVNNVTSGNICKPIFFSDMRVCSTAALAEADGNNDPREKFKGLISLSYRILDREQQSVDQEICVIPVTKVMMPDGVKWTMIKSLKYSDCKIL